MQELYFVVYELVVLVDKDCYSSYGVSWEMYVETYCNPSARAADGATFFFFRLWINANHILELYTLRVSTCTSLTKCMKEAWCQSFWKLLLR